MTGDVLIGLLGAAGAIVAAIVIVWGGSFAYKRQKEIDRKEQLVVKRREVYRDLLIAVSLSTSNKGPEADRAYRNAKSEVFVYGSDKVIKCMKSLANLLEGKAPGTGNDQLRAYASLVHAMRQDSFEGSNLTVDQLSELTPFHQTDTR